MKSLFARIITWIKLHKRISISAAVVVVLVGGGLLGYYLLQNKPWLKRTSTATKTAENKPKTKASPLTGVQLAPELADRPIQAVVIENSPDARPQSGLADAGVVYEALAEGGITRFLAFFLEGQPAKIGPVRSLRTYFVDWALEYDAPVAHWGGNIEAIALVKPLGLKDMDEFYNSGSFYRDNTRYAPHNGYTSTELLDKLKVAMGYNKPATFAPSPRKADTPPTAEAPAAHPIIKINYSFPAFQAEYRYDSATNDYGRWLAGQPHVDRNTGQQIRVKNIVVEYMPTKNIIDRAGQSILQMSTPGSGNAVVFRDGGAVTGTWSKSSHTDRTKLKDAAGADIPLNAGNTWYSIVPVGQSVTY